MPLEGGIWRYTEDDVAAPAVSDLLNLAPDSVRAALAPLRRTGAGTVSSNLFSAANLTVALVGVEVHLDNYGVLIESRTIAPSGTLVLGVLSHPPKRQWLGPVSTVAGALELLILTNGTMTLRNWSASSVTIPADGHIGMSSVRYETAS